MKIAWYSYYKNPWRNVLLKMWQHHADIMELISREADISIYPLLKPSEEYNIRKYNDGDKSVITSGYENIDFVFNETDDFSYLDEMDACFLEVSRVVLYAKQNNLPESIEASKILKEKISYLMSRNIPILWYDGDADFYWSTYSGKYSFNEELYNELDMGSYENLTVVGPYEIGLTKKCERAKINNFKFVPYNINFEKVELCEIKGSEGREYLSTYIGNNFKRTNFIKVFNNVSNFGKMRIFGSRWDKDKFSNNVELNGSIKAKENGFKDYFDESLFGLYGSFNSSINLKHYTLRVTEYLSSGIYIVPSNDQYLVEKFPEGNIFCEDFENEQTAKEKIKYLKDNYEELVMEQRKCLSKTFDSRNLYDVYKQAFKIN